MAEEERKMTEEEFSQIRFIQYVSILANSGMMQLGKIMNPVTGKIEKSIEAAQATIALLEMLKDKTKGNLTSDEEGVLSEALANLQLNFADEVSRKIQEAAESKEEKKEEKKD